MKFNERDLELINRISRHKFTTSEEINSMDKDDVLKLTVDLGSLIGYDSTIGDIDALGLEADNIISKLLIMLEKRGEM